MTDTGRDAPAPLIAHYNLRRIALQFVVMTAFIALIFLAPHFLDETPTSELPAERQQELSEAQQEMQRFEQQGGFLADRVVLGGVIGFFVLLWAVSCIRRMRDRRPQLVIDTNGIFMRNWHLGIVPWERIAQMSVSRPGLRTAIQALLHNRRGAYVIVHFNDRPPVETDWPGWLAVVQRAWRESDVREAVISPNNLDTSLSSIMAALRDHAAHWRERNPEKIREHDY
ncbi:MAG: hypothetical protein AB7N54_15560 [Alphaproteobacteria bacterium]